MLTHAIEIQQIPAPTFSESERSAYIAEKFHSLGLQQVTIDRLGNVFARTLGGDDPRLVLTAHLDTVFPPGTRLDIHREGTLLVGPGIGDNAIALACMLEIAEAYNGENHNNAGLWLVANVREEGLGNLEGMYNVVEKFEDRVSAYIVLEGMGLGHIYHRGLHVQRYRIAVETQGGHAWIHAGRESAIHRLMMIGAEVTEIPRPQHIQTSLNIGSVLGGTSINTIASTAHFDLDLRSESAEVLGDLQSDLEGVLKKYQTDEVTVRSEIIGHRPGGEIPAEHELVRLACEATEAGEVTECLLGIASTDANVPLSKGYPAVCIGLSQGGHAHTAQEFIDIETIPNGYRLLDHLIQGALKLPLIRDAC